MGPEHVPKLDIDRSFNFIEEPRRSELRNQLTTIMPLLCTKLDAKYWQGMHDIVSGMLLIEPQPPMERIFVILSAFLQRFLPFAFNDEDAVHLRHLLEVVRLILQYHDPGMF